MGSQSGKQKFVYCLVAGFLIGIFYANLAAKSYVTASGIFQESFLSGYDAKQIESADYLWYLLRVRCLPLSIFVMIGWTKMRKIGVFACLLWTGFSGGVLFSAAVLKLGIRGVVLCVIGITPQFFFYALGYLILFWYFYRYPQSTWTLPKTMTVSAAIIAGLCAEVYVNPILMELFLDTL